MIYDKDHNGLISKNNRGVWKKYSKKKKRDQAVLWNVSLLSVQLNLFLLYAAKQISLFYLQRGVTWTLIGSKS